MLALLVTVLWSSSWVLIRWGLDDEGLSPLMFAALRYGLAAVVRDVIRAEQYQLPGGKLALPHGDFRSRRCVTHSIDDLIPMRERIFQQFLDVSTGFALRL